MTHRPYQRAVVGNYSDGSPMQVNFRTWAMLDVLRDRLGYAQLPTIPGVVPPHVRGKRRHP